MAHTIVGTPYYLSPELCEEKPYNHKSDIWSLGCVLYELCTFKHPFEAKNQGQLIMKIVRGQFTPVSSKYSEALREMVRMLLLKNYKKRPSMAEILNTDEMKKRMQLYGYSSSDQIPSQVPGAGNNLFQKAYREEQKGSNSQDAKPKFVGIGDKPKFIDNKLVPDIEKLRKELAQKNQIQQKDGASKPTVSSSAVSALPSGALAKRPVSEAGANHAQINYEKYKQLLNMPNQLGQKPPQKNEQKDHKSQRSADKLKGSELIVPPQRPKYGQPSGDLNNK